MSTEAIDSSNSPQNKNPEPIHHRHLYLWSSSLSKSDERYDEKTNRPGVEKDGSLMCEEFVNILIYNWRDIKNPASGGAEVLTHEIAKRLVLKGHKITLFTAAFPGCKEKETIDDVEIIRSGGRYTVY